MSLIEPLRLRPGGIRFSCHGDGLCCYDMHAWGPLDEVEVAMLYMIDEAAVAQHGDDMVVAGTVEGRCMFADEDGCALHSQLGPEHKPKACQQFPYMLIATPTGGRIATEHRCPCRTMGARAEVTVEEALECCDPEALDRTITESLPLDDDTEMDKETWEAIEAPLLSGEAKIDAPPMSGGDWAAIGKKLRETAGDSRFAQALRLFGAAVLEEDELPRPDWKDAFDRAEARSEEGDPEAMLDDWMRDVIWSLDWAFHGTWMQAQIDLASRAEIARRIMRGLGGRPDRAMAEAITAVELAGLDDDYTEFVGSLRAPKAP